MRRIKLQIQKNSKNRSEQFTRLKDVDFLWAKIDYTQESDDYSISFDGHLLSEATISKLQRAMPSIKQTSVSISTGYSNDSYVCNYFETNTADALLLKDIEEFKSMTRYKYYEPLDEDNDIELTLHYSGASLEDSKHAELKRKIPSLRYYTMKYGYHSPNYPSKLSRKESRFWGNF